MIHSPQPHTARFPEATSGNKDPYASSTQSRALLAVGAAYRRERIEAADMLTTDQAAEHAGTSRVTINAWIKSGRAIGLQHLRRGFRLPAWQFEPGVHSAVLAVANGLGTTDGWQLLHFFETAHTALDGEMPRLALERGTPIDRVVAAAKGDAY